MYVLINFIFLDFSYIILYYERNLIFNLFVYLLDFCFKYKLLLYEYYFFIMRIVYNIVKRSFLCFIDKIDIILLFLE